MRHALPQRRAAAPAAALALLFGTALGADTVPIREVRQAGPTAVVYRGPQLEVALSYKFSKLNPGGTWLLLDTTLAATRGPVEIPRSAFSLRTPDGAVVPLASPHQYFSAYARLASSIMKDDAIRQPLGLLIAPGYRPLRYFPRYPSGLAFDAEWVDHWHNSYGRLLFELPDGVREGRYALLINLPEGKVVIPFTL